jgi:hypothetical protein
MCLESKLDISDSELGLLDKLDCRFGRVLPGLGEDNKYCDYFCHRCH